MIRTRTARRAWTAGACCALLAMTATACGGSDEKAAETAATTANPGVAYAVKEVEKAKAVPEFTLDAPAFDASKARGKLIFNIPSSSANPFNLAIDQEMEKIAKDYGVEFFEYENQGTPTEYSAGIQQAIARGADVISLMTANPGVAGPALRDAEAAGIPVVSSHIFHSVDAVPASVASSITAVVTAPFEPAARLMADWVIADSGGNADILVITSEEQLPSKAMVAAVKDELSKHCEDCKSTVINVPANDWGQKLGPEVRSALTSNPNITHVMPLYDSELLFVEPALRAAGKLGDIKMISYNGTPGPLKIVQDSKGGAVVIGENVNWLAYANMDQIFRVLAGEPPIADGNEQTPLRLFDETNIGETGTPPTPDQGYGDAYVKGYEDLWNGD